MTPTRSAARRLALVAATILVVAGCQTPRQQAAVTEALNDAANQIDGLRSDVDELQTDVDSLRLVLAYQDTMIGRLAALNHLPVQRAPAIPSGQP